MAIKYNGITLENIKYGNTQLDKVIFNNTVVWENYEYTYFSYNTYHLGGGSEFSAEDIKDLGTPCLIVSSTISFITNKGVNPTYILYGSTDNSNWVELGRITGEGTITVTDKTPYRYVKIYQSTSQWRRNDGNEVCSIEPWRVDYGKRKK